MAHEQKHPYHLVEPSPWPFVGAGSGFVLAAGGALYMHDKPFGGLMTIIGLGLVLMTMFFWWRDVLREAHYQGHHTPVVQIGARYGMMLFIASEVMFFLAFFWAYFDFALYPRTGEWPPEGIETFDPFDLPLLNTLILLLSGTTVTWAHAALLDNDRKNLLLGLGLTVLLGISFTALQAIEYSHAAFGFTEGGVSVDLLHGDRLPRLPRDRRHHLPDRVLVPRLRRSLHAAAAFRVRGGGLVLALRRRGLAVPVRLHLLVGRLIASAPGGSAG